MTNENEVRILGLTEEGQENVEVVSKLLSDGNLKWTNIEKEDVFATTSLKEDVMYVVDPTEGDEVDYLVKLGYPVIGPQCAITVLKHNIKLTPSIVYPVHNLTMHKTQICFSNFNHSEREIYKNRVERMGGNFTKTLVNNTTHLVVKEVGSVKYFSAASWNIPIMTSQWLDHLWTHGQARYISALKGNWEDFRCPIFLGCSVCATGFPTSKKNTIQNLVKKFGGSYSGSMTLNVTTHLVVNKPEGQKYASANQFGVKVVNIDWIFKSVEKKFCQDHNKYPIKPVDKLECSILKSSTPEKSTTARNRNPTIHDVSNISVMMVNETVSTSISDISRMSSCFLPPLNVGRAKEDLFKFPTTKSYDQILDNICVYIVGFTSKEEEKIKQLLSISGATRFNQLTPSITHILVGTSTGVTDTVLQSIKQALNQKDRELWVISYKWLLKSLCSNEIKPELEFWCEDLIEKPKHVTAPTTIDETTFNSRPNSMLGKTTVLTHNEDETATDVNFTDMQDVLSQYIDMKEDDTTLNNDNDEAKKDVTVVSNDITMNDDADESNYSKYKNVQSVNKSVHPALIFEGKLFICYGFDEEIEAEKCNDIEAHKGVMLSAYSKKIPDYAIVPVTGWPVEKTVGSIVTEFWLDSCISENQLLPPDFHPMSTPFLISEDCLPLNDCVLCLSLYTHPLRGHIEGFIEDLGGVYQDNVARKEQIIEDGEILHQTTHLVVPTPEGEKFEGCQRWGISCVSDEWIYECARKGKRVSEEKYLILPQIKEKTMIMTATKSSTKRSYGDMVLPPKWDEADEIAKKYKEKFQAQKLEEEKTETPLRVKFLRMNVKTPSHQIARKPVDLSFNLDECFAMLKTPDAQQRQIKKAIASAPDTPVSVFVKRFLKESIKEKYESTKSEIVKSLLFDLVQHDNDPQDSTTTNLETSKNNISELCLKLNQTGNDGTKMDNDGSYIENDETNFERGETNLMNDETNLDNDVTNFENGAIKMDNDETQSVVEPLKEVVLFVTKKLAELRAEQNSMARELGGEFRWNYDSSVTHVVFQGKQNDREFRKAKEDDKIIVSPYWLKACFDTKTRENEAEYPHLYNPSKSIEMLNMSQSQSSYKLNATNRRRTRKSDQEINNSTASLQTTVDSQEARENLRKTVENIISSTTKSSLTAHRLSGNRDPSTFSSPLHLLKRNSTTANDNVKAEKPESSQDVHVMWDDPTEREELERIMKEQSLLEKLKEEETIDVAPTPPSVEPITSGEQQTEEEVDSSRMSQILREGKTPSFLVSSVTAEEKANYAALIDGLGGVYLNKDQYDRSCTHLIVKKPVRNEKFLSCLAAGKWILHTSYMNACREAGQFIKEDEFEYGNPSFTIQPQTELERHLMAAAHRWRSQKNKIKSEAEFGAFKGWEVVLHINERQLTGFTRLLLSGHGLVAAKSLPYTGPLNNITHAIIEPTRLNDSIDIMPLLEANIHCCRPDYIAEHLMQDPPPKAQSYYIPQVKEILKNLSIDDASMEMPSKRRRT